MPKGAVTNMDTVLSWEPVQPAYERMPFFIREASEEVWSLPVIPSINFVNDAMKVLEHTKEYNLEAEHALLLQKLGSFQNELRFTTVELPHGRMALFGLDERDKSGGYE